jgi:hypothetical protein
MQKFIEANPDLVAAEIGFLAEKDKKHKEDEEHNHKIKAEVDELFD